MAGIYVHIPFCHSKCIYCDFFSTPRLSLSSGFAKAVIKEYQRRRSEIIGTIQTLYFGGGTPSILPASELAKIARALPTDAVEEFTLEVNPEDVNSDAVKSWIDIGVNRVSMGIQSFDDSQLKAIGRRHSADDARRAIDCLRQGGITNLSCDLIYGLPGQDVKSWIGSLLELLSYHLPHISTYCLSYEPGTALFTKMTAGKVNPCDDDMLEEMYIQLIALCKQNGYEHYEISNFSLPGMRSRHNSAYWNETPYLGLGPGAHSFDGRVRRYNRNDIKTYIETSDVNEIDEENVDECFNDRLITALRTSDGLDLNDLTPEKSLYVTKAIDPYLKERSIIREGSRIRITESAWLRSDAILRELIII